MKSLIKPIVVLTLISLLCTASLAGVNMLTKEIIEKSEAEKITATMNELIKDDKGFEKIELSTDELSKYSANALYKSNSGKGYIADVTASGYSGEINVMIAFNEGLKISGIKVLSHEETKGVGTRVFESDSFFEQFTGKDTNKEQKTDVISGASVTSKAVISAVNSAVALVNDVE